MIKHKKLKFIALAVLVSGCFVENTSVFAIAENDRSNPQNDINGMGNPFMHPAYSGNSATARLFSDINLINNITRRIEELRNQINAMQANSPDKEKMETILKNLIDRRDAMAYGSNIGTLIAQAMVSKQSKEYLAGTSISGPLEGIKTGVTVRTAEVFGTKLSKALEVVVGDSLETLFQKGVDAIEAIKRNIFNNGTKSFEVNHLHMWLFAIQSAFNHVELIVKKGMENISRGYAMTLREVGNEQNAADSGQQTNDANDKQKEEVVNTAWSMLMQGFCSQFDRFIDEIEQRKGYYDKDSTEVHFAEQICISLQEFSKTLLSSKSIRDLIDHLEEQGGFVYIQVTRDYIKTCFECLNTLIQPKAKMESSMYTSSQKGPSRKVDRDNFDFMF